MVTQAELKAVRSLHQRKNRDAEGLYLVQGLKMVGELRDAELRAEAIYATEEAARALGLGGVRILPAHQLEKLGTLESGNEVVAVVRKPASEWTGTMGANELVLALDGVADPGNLGTIVRIADWFGVEHILLGEGSVDPYNPKCVQASMGSFFRVHVHEAGAQGLVGLMPTNAHVYKAEMEGANVFEAELKRPAVLVLGNESRGLSDAVRSMPGTSITIPRYGGSESLNVAMAASALCMEFARRNT